MSITKTQTAIDYIAFLESQSSSDDEQVSEDDSPRTQHISDSFDVLKVKEQANHDDGVVRSDINAGAFNSVLGMLKARKSVTLEQMDEAVRKRGAGL